MKIRRKPTMVTLRLLVSLCTVAAAISGAASAVASATFVHGKSVQKVENTVDTVAQVNDRLERIDNSLQELSRDIGEMKGTLASHIASTTGQTTR